VLIALFCAQDLGVQECPHLRPAAANLTKGKSLREIWEQVNGPDQCGGPDLIREGIASATVWHSFDHYGEMVVSLRMNGIIPPTSR